MARGRLISRSLGSSRRFHTLLKVGGKLGEFCQLLFPLIVVNTDDFGRMPGDAFTVKHVVLPSSPRPEADFERALVTMSDVGLLVRYAVDDVIYLSVNNFDANQPNLKKRTSSKFPDIPGNSRIPKKVLPNLTELNLTESNRTQNRRNAPTGDDDAFDAFWAAYPKKTAEQDAKQAWAKIHPDAALLAVMLRALVHQQHSPDWQRESGRYVPHPATWLRAQRWLDEAPEPAPGSVAWVCQDDPPCPAGTTAFHCHQRHGLESARRVARA